MKKSVFMALAIIILIMTSSVNGYARGGGGGHGGHVGIGILLGPWWGFGYPFYPNYPYYPYYAAPPVVSPPEAEVYVQPAPQAEETGYWYYCRDPEGYYPYVKRCPNGWMRVVPSPPAAEEE